MIFKPELVEKILAGEKTETRRPVKPGETECRYKEGRTYAVQPGRGESGVALIRILRVWREGLGEITNEGAMAEGFSQMHRFYEHWDRLHGRDSSNDREREVWVIRFELEKTNEERSVS